MKDITKMTDWEIENIKEFSDQGFDFPIESNQTYHSQCYYNYDDYPGPYEDTEEAN